VILVKLDNPRGASYYGGRVAAPVSKVVLEAAIAARDASLDRSRLAAAPRRRGPDLRPAQDSARAVATAAAAESRAAPAYVVELGNAPPNRRLCSRASAQCRTCVAYPRALRCANCTRRGSACNS
jgi:hypothetical protein